MRNSKIRSNKSVKIIKDLSIKEREANGWFDVFIDGVIQNKKALREDNAIAFLENLTGTMGA